MGGVNVMVEVMLGQFCDVDRYCLGDGIGCGVVLYSFVCAYLCNGMDLFYGFLFV